MLLPRRPSPATDAVLTIAPRVALRAGAAACAQRNGPMRFVDRMSCQNASVMASRSANSIGCSEPGVPALLIRMSSRPSPATASPTIRSASPGVETLPGAGTTLSPAPSSRAISSGARLSCGRWFMATAAPLFANSSTAASPMPDEPPVTRTVLPERSAPKVCSPSHNRNSGAVLPSTHPEVRAKRASKDATLPTQRPTGRCVLRGSLRSHLSMRRVEMPPVIDVSGDGPNNTGRMVTLARDEAVRQGVTINGLPFMLKRPTGYGDIENLDLYYQDCVIGGPGAFILPVREARHFAEAVRTKLVREIAGVFEPEPLIKPAQERERMNCLIGEIMRRQRFGP